QAVLKSALDRFPDHIGTLLSDDPRQTFRLADLFPTRRCKLWVFALTPAVASAASIAELREPLATGTGHGSPERERSSLCSPWARQRVPPLVAVVSTIKEMSALAQ